MKVRKHIRDARITKVYQYDLDRVVVIEFASGQMLVLELFSKGNIILVEGDRIVACLRMEKWRDRTLRPGEIYVFPKGKQERPDFSEILKGKESLVKTLVKNLNLSPKYCEELCLRAGYEKDTEAGKTEPLRIEKAMNELVTSKYSPVKYLSEGKVIDVAPFPLKIYAGPKDAGIDKGYPLIEEVPVKSLSEVLDEFSLVSGEKKSKFQIITEKTREELEERLKKIVEYQRMGDYIYEHYAEFKEVLKNHKTDQRVKRRDGKFIEVELGSSSEAKMARFD